MGNITLLSERPGSLQEFLSANPGTTHEDYGKVLDSYRAGTARALGITAFELHEMSSGRLADELQRLSEQGETA